MASTFDVVVNRQSLDMLLDYLRDEVEFVDLFINSLYDRLLSAAESWSGASYDGYAEMMGKYSTYFFNYLDLIRTYHETLSNDATTAIETLETDVKDAMNL